MIGRHHMVPEALQKERELAILRTQIQHAAGSCEELAIRASERLFQIGECGERFMRIPLEARICVALFRGLHPSREPPGLRNQ
jgi:hypothetical protein